MPTTDQYSVAIIGLGQVGATYGDPTEESPYCHAGGVLHSPRVRLSAAVDRAAPARERFAQAWGPRHPGVRYFESVAGMLDHGVPDIVAVCIHATERPAELARIVAAGPRAIFLEKPASCSVAEFDALTARTGAAKTLLTVSYSRHWTPHVLRLQELVGAGLIGEVRRVEAYSPGERLVSFIGHTVDLLCQFAGYRPRTVEAVGDLSANGDGVPAGYEGEPSYERVSVEFDSGIVGTVHGKAGPHGYWYCDVIGTEGTARAGLYVPPTAARLDGSPIPLEELGMPAEASVFAVAYDQIAVALDGGPLPACSGDDATAVNEIGFAAVESMHTGGPVDLPLRNRERRVYANA